MAVQPLGAGGAAASLLFTRLPERLFAPLASPNKQTYWGILCALYDRRFGPDAPLPPSHGFTTRDITQDIEDVLVIHDSWTDEDGATPERRLASGPSPFSTDCMIAAGFAWIVMASTSGCR